MQNKQDSNPWPLQCNASANASALHTELSNFLEWSDCLHMFWIKLFVQIISSPVYKAGTKHFLTADDIVRKPTSFLDWKEGNISTPLAGNEAFLFTFK